MIENGLTRDMPPLLRADAEVAGRRPRCERIACDLVVVGGGMAGTCAAITAARQGLAVTLIQDRPVLGGNASSEVRLWLLGATVHMGSNNRWAREGGVIGEIFVENLWRNPEGNAVIFDSLVLEKAVSEPNLRLLLNTAVDGCEKDGPDRIAAVSAFCAQNSTRYHVSAPLFCDASGDGILGFCAGAAFRMGAEAKTEFGEGNAPSGEFGRLLGHSIYFFSKDTGRPVRYVPPSWAITDITKIPRWRQFDAKSNGCRLWWIEWGGRFDTVHDSEAIKWELWRIVYGVWNHIKNSGSFPDAANLTLEWVGMIPGKRESRRFEGPHILTQQDIVERRQHADVVAHGGWSIDLHPADGVYSPLAGSHHLQSKAPYGIPFRCYHSRNIANLFLAGRIISASHVAFGSIRVMATCAAGGQAVGTAAAICRELGLEPAALDADPVLMGELQRRLLRTGHYLPGRPLSEDNDLARQADIIASSSLLLSGLPDDAEPIALGDDRAQMLPAIAGPFPAVTLVADCDAPCRLTVQLRTSRRTDEHCPEEILAERTLDLPAGRGIPVGPVDFGVAIDQPRYVWIVAKACPGVRLHQSEQRISGVLSVFRPNWSWHDAQQSKIGGEDFEFWVPERRPGGRNFAIRLASPIAAFASDNLRNGFSRPISGANAWVADLADPAPRLTLAWTQPQAIARVELAFDVDFDHAMETVIYGHPESVVPFCVRSFRLLDGSGRELFRCDENHHAEVHATLPASTVIDRLVLEITGMNGPCPAAVFALRCYAPGRAV